MGDISRGMQRPHAAYGAADELARHGELCRRLDTLIGVTQHLSELLSTSLAPDNALPPLIAENDAPVYGTPNDTPASPISGRISACLVAIGAGNGDGAIVQVFMRHGTLPGGQVEMFHGWVGSGVVANVIAPGRHCPKDTIFRLNVSNAGGGSLQSIGMSVYVDPSPRTAPEIFRTQRT